MTKDWPFASKRHEALTQAARHAIQRAEDLRISDPEEAAEWLQVASELDPDRAAAEHQARLAAEEPS